MESLCASPCSACLAGKSCAHDRHDHATLSACQVEVALAEAAAGEASVEHLAAAGEAETLGEAEALAGSWPERCSHSRSLTQHRCKQPIRLPHQTVDSRRQAVKLMHTQGQRSRLWATSLCCGGWHIQASMRGRDGLQAHQRRGQPEVCCCSQ